MTNQHCYYNKEISWSQQLFQRTDIARESVNLKKIDRNLALKLIVIFNAFTDISFLKYATKIFYISYFFQECFQGYFESLVRYNYQWLCLYILSSKGAIKLQILFIRTLGYKLLKLGFSSWCNPKDPFSEKLEKF